MLEMLFRTSFVLVVEERQRNMDKQTRHTIQMRSEEGMVPFKLVRLINVFLSANFNLISSSSGDYEYYLSQQVLPPIERLCDPIEGTDRARLAECLGLDPGRFRSYVGNDTNERVFGTLESQMPDSIRFKDCEPLTIRCRHCDGRMPFTHVSERAVSSFFFFVSSYFSSWL